MLVECYRGFQIEVAAMHSDGAWNADVRIRRTFSEKKLRVETLTCRKPTAKVAEERDGIFARRWVDALERNRTRPRSESQ